jgi:cyclopropane fatty-acyl-phospholipid synthase-like methyltransferase
VYTHGQHESVLRSYSWRSVENSAAYLIPYLRPGIALLDVGCGPGTITADLAERIRPGKVTAVDASPDVHAPDVPDESFDVVHAHQVLQHVTDPVAALREMRRVCRRGGVVAVRDADYAAMTWYPADPGVADWLALYQRIARHNGGEPDAGRRLHGWARGAGFLDVACSSSTWTYATPTERSWWSGVWIDRLSVSALAQQATDERHATAEELQRMREGWASWAGAEDGWFAILHGEIICRR